MQQHIRDYTELCLKDAHGIYTVQVDNTGMSCTELTNNLYRSVLLACGFVEATVDAVLGPYGSGRVDEPCEYQAGLEKIMDALHADNAEQALSMISDYKRVLAGVRYLSGATVGEDLLCSIKRIVEERDRMSHDVSESHQWAEERKSLLSKLGAESYAEAIDIINDMRSISAGRMNKLAAIREASGAKEGEDTVDAVKTLRKEAEWFGLLTDEAEYYMGFRNSVVVERKGKRIKVERIG